MFSPLFSSEKVKPQRGAHLWPRPGVALWSRCFPFIHLITYNSLILVGTASWLHAIYGLASHDFEE